MNANIAGIYGAQIFRQDDRPLYRRGFSVAIAVLSVGLVLVIARWIDDLLRRRRKANQLETSASEQGSNDEADIKAYRPSDVQPQPVLIGADLKPVVPEAVR
jgi:hypothetical protein